jgi:hypothetical protein
MDQPVDQRGGDHGVASEGVSVNFCLCNFFHRVAFSTSDESF